jgi:leucyl/phenylalanyl-tRNA--protein transferase
LLPFPPLHTADSEGLLAIGGDLSPERLQYAYEHGIFPWFSGDIPMWWSPDPRFVLFPQELIVTKSMKQVISSGKFRLTINTAFQEVIEKCSEVARKGQDGTWITKEMINAYITLHEKGMAVSAETWQGDELVGGLYGVRVGNVFCGESMFSTVSNASKFAFIKFTQQLISEGCTLIDCQVYTDHLASLGAKMMPRARFVEYLNSY